MPKKSGKKRPVRQISKSRARIKNSSATSKAQVASAASVSLSSSHRSHFRELFLWSVALIGLFAVLSVVASYATQAPQQNASSLPQKLPQADTLSLATEGKNEASITLIATGDILLARFVELRMRKMSDYIFPFRKVSDFLKSADITFGNLETPIISGKNTPTGSMTFRADPESVAGLTEAGYDVLSIANNHAMNFRADGLLRTIEELNKAGIAPVGGGKNMDSAHTPVIKEVKGKKIAFYAYNDSSIPPGFHGEALWDKPGIAQMDIESVKNDVKNALEKADIVVVSMHAGMEYTKKPTKFQQSFARAAIDAGASVVIGHHPHVTQPVEYYKDGIIFYSLGNFVFDQFFSEEVKMGLVTRITFDAEGKAKAELFPVKIDLTQPRIAEGEERTALLKKMGFEGF